MTHLVEASPCPFCGRGHERVDVEVSTSDDIVVVRCTECRAEGPRCRTMTMALGAWNYRAIHGKAFDQREDLKFLAVTAVRHGPESERARAQALYLAAVRPKDNIMLASRDVDKVVGKRLDP